MFEKLFKLKEHNTTIGTELMAGLTSFIAMAYILAVNPNILSAAGMNPSAVMAATAIAAFVGCLSMALLANYPFALAPGLGLNAYFAYTVCQGMGYSYKYALFAVFVEGLIFIVLTLTSLRERLVDSIPMVLKKSISGAIGIFIAFIGLQGANIIMSNSSTMVSLINFHQDFKTSGIGAVLAIIGLIIVVLLHRKGVKGTIILGVFITWILGIICELLGIYTPDPEAGFYSLLPNFSSFSLASVGENFGACFDFSQMNFNLIEFVVIIFSLLYMDMFDTMGTLVGVASHSGMLDDNGKLPKAKEAMLADAIATSAGAVVGTSTTTTFVESAAGVETGGRTGLTSLTTGILFLMSIVLAPIFTAIPSFATAPALIYVGFLMFMDVVKIDFTDITDGVPAFLCLIMMPLTYSISDGIAAGVISYTIINLLAGKKEKINIILLIISVLFIIKYIFL